MRWLRKVLLLLAIAGVVVVGLPALHAPREDAPLPPRTGPALRDVTAWGYQLQRTTAAAIPPGVDLLVTDHSRDGSDAGAWTAADVAALRRRGDAPPRIVLAYLSIGEAESYRGYWRKHWRVVPPSWLGAENKDWKGNFAVKFWDRAWQRLLFDAEPGLVTRTLRYWLPAFAPQPYLDRILAAGFDGVYLDKVDGYEDWHDRRPQASDDMVALVGAIADYARRKRPGFLIVPQNAEELLGVPRYRAKIDAIAKEDLFYGIAGEGQPNDPGEVATAQQHLALALSEGKPVFVVEYVHDPAIIDNLKMRSATAGYRLLFATRELGLPPEPAGQASPLLRKPDK